MLGVFLLGLLTRRQANLTNIPVMLISTAACLVLLLLIKHEIFKLGWSWLIVIGTAITFVMGYLLGPAIKESEKSKCKMQSDTLVSS